MKKQSSQEKRLCALTNEGTYGKICAPQVKERRSSMANGRRKGRSAFGDFMRTAKAGRKTGAGQRESSNHRGGFGNPLHGWIDGEPVTVAFGWGTKEGHTLLADGHVNLSTFKQHGNHNHYGTSYY
jgi:hypothetical protein